MATIISSVITGLIAIVVCIINANSSHKSTLAELNKHNEMQLYRIEQLEKKVEKHNKIVERTYRLEEATALQEEKIKVANHRLDDLESK